MVTNYPQQLTATATGQVAHDKSASGGQSREHALHLVRIRNSRVGDQRAWAAQALRRRRAPSPARDAASRAAQVCVRIRRAMLTKG